MDAHIYQTLRQWQVSTAHLEEDGYRVPSPESLATAIRIVTAWMWTGEYDPQRVVPDGDGGVSIVINACTSIEIGDDGRAALLSFKGNKSHVEEYHPIQEAAGEKTTQEAHEEPEGPDRA